MWNIDHYAYISKLKKMDPMVKLVFALLTLAVNLWADWLVVSITVLFIMGWVSIRKGGTPFPVFIKLLMIPAFFLIPALISIPFDIANNSEGFFISIPFFNVYLVASANGLSASFGLFWKSLGAASCLYFLALSTPIVDLLITLRKLKFPALFVELMGLIYRFIFILIETAENIFTAQNSRLGYVDLRLSYHSLVSLTSTLFIRAYRRSEELYTALESRGYEGEIKVLMETYPKQKHGYLAVITVNFFLIVINVIWKGQV